MSGLAIRGVGVLGPGLAGWPASRDVLAGRAAWQEAAVVPPALAALPVTERRRINAASRWTIAVAEEAMAASGARGPIAGVFASADGDGDVLDQTLAALASADPTLSPTLFHNSVYNAPSGYWSIATRSTGGATMLCAAEGSVAAALLEAAAQAAATDAPVLVVAVDLQFPARLASLRGPGRSFACALVLDPGMPTGDVLGTIAVGGIVDANDARSADPLTAAFDGNAAASAIPLLAMLARGERGAIALPYLDGQALRVEVAAP